MPTRSPSPPRAGAPRACRRAAAPARSAAPTPRSRPTPPSPPTACTIRRRTSSTTSPSSAAFRTCSEEAMTASCLRLAACGVLIALAAPGARADEIDTLNSAIENYNDQKYRPAATGFYKIEETSTVADNRFKAEYYLAQSLNKLGLGFASFFYYGQIIKAGPAHPYYFKSVEGALRVTEESRDEVLGPNVLNRAYNEQIARLPPDVLAKINYYIALLGYRAGRYAEAEQFLQGVPRESTAYAQAHYVQGLLAQRADPARAVGIFQEVLAMEDTRYRDPKEA